MLLFAVLAWFDILGRHVEQRQRQLLIWLACAGMVCFAGARWSGITLEDMGDGGIFDYVAYKHAFDAKLSLSDFWHDYINSDNRIRSMDVGYVFICTLFAHILPNAHWWFMLYSLGSVLLLFAALRRTQITQVLFFVLFVYVARLYFQYNFILIRQAMAMAIVWCAIPFIEERRWWRFLLLCLLAATQHVSALIFLIAWPLSRLRLSNIFVLITLSTLFLAGVFGITSKIIMSALGASLGVIGVDSRLAGYLLRNNIGINLLNFIEVLPFFYLAFQFKQEILAARYGRLFFNMLIFYTAYLAVTMDFMDLTRVSSYFIFFMFFVVNFAFTHFRLRTNTMVVGVFLWIYFMIYALRYLIAGKLISTNYDFVLFHL